MMKRIIALLLLSLFIPTSYVTAEVLQKSSSQSLTTDLQKDVKSKIGLLKIPFIKNEAQINNLGVKYYANIISGNVFVADDSITYSLFNGTGSEVKRWIVKEKFIGSKKTLVEGIKESPTKVNFFKGKENENWKMNIPTYEVISFGEVYDDIRLTLKAYGTNVEKVFLVEKRGNPEEIAIDVEGARDLKINREGELEITRETDMLKMTAPSAYQEIGGEKVKVAVAYSLKNPDAEADAGFVYGFKVGEYDRTKALIIDPLPKPQATFLGGNYEDKATSIALDSNGNVYVAGYTKSGPTFHFDGAQEYYDGTRGNLDIFVAKLDNDLMNLISIAFIGGSNDDYGNAIALDQAGNVYVAGYTTSINFPGIAPPPPLGTHAFVLKTNSDLSSLLFAKQIVLGATIAEYANSIAIDSVDSVVYVAGYTIWPTGNVDAFVSKHLEADLSQPAFKTVGGTSSDYAYSVSVNAATGFVYIAGSTASTDFPVTVGAYDVTHNGDGTLDAFVAVLDEDLNILAATYLGGSYNDVATSIAVSQTGDVFVTGWTASTGHYNGTPSCPTNYVPPTFPTTPGAYDRALDCTVIPDDRVVDAFVSKFNPDLRLLFASTLLGGAKSAPPLNGSDQANAIVLDNSGNVYVTGWTTSSDFPTTEGAFDQARKGEEDVFISHLAGNLSALLASTFLGGSSHDVADGIGLDNDGIVFVTGYTDSVNFMPPQITEGYDPVYHSTWDAFVYRQRPDLSKVYSLTVTFLGDGHGTVTSSPEGINCLDSSEAVCDAEYNRVITVTLTAAPSQDSTFDSWAGLCEQIGTNPDTCTVTVNEMTSVSATFRLTTFTIDATADTGGSISPSGSTTVSYGADISFLVVPDSTHYISDIIVDGNSVGGPVPPIRDKTYQFSNITSNHTIRAVFRANPQITVTANSGGTVSPSGTVVVSYGGSQSFAITPDSSHYIGDVIVNGVSKGAVTTYQFTDVRVDSTIVVDFRVKPVITTSVEGGGTISPSGSVAASYHGSLTFTMTPNVGNYLTNVLVDGTSQGVITTTYTFTDIVADHTIRAIFRANPQITVTANSGGTVSPSGTVIVAYGANQSFTITPDSSHYIGDVIANGVSKGAVSTYQFTDVRTDSTLVVDFRAKPVITASVEGGGTISPSGSVTASYDGSLTFTMTPNAGNYLVNVLVDGAPQVPVSPTYTFTHIIADHTIRAIFRANPQITVTANSGGTVSPSGTVIVAYGANQSFTITPDSSHYIGDVIANGVSKGAVSTYQFTDVRTDSTLVVDFRAKPVITASVEGGGTISPSGSVAASYHGSLIFTMTPNAGNYLTNVLVDGTSQGVITTYTFTDVVADHTIRAVFRANPVITTSVEGGGTISPSGSVAASYHGSLTFTMTPNAGNYLADVLVDGTSKGPVTTYTFTDVVVDHAILAVFRPNPVIVAAVEGDGTGTISPTGSVIASYHGNIRFMITPVSSFRYGWDGKIVAAYTGSFVDDVVVDGVSIGPQASYEFKDVTEDHTITVKFAQQKPPSPYTIKATANSGGTIKPFGVINSGPLITKTFYIKPYKGYYILDVKTDGESKGPLSTYSFKSVAASHTIEAIFAEKKVVTVLKEGTGNGTVKSSPKGINCGKDCSEPFNTNSPVILVANPSKDSVFKGWSGGGDECEGTSTCVLTLTEDTTVTATFDLK